MRKALAILLFSLIAGCSLAAQNCVPGVKENTFKAGEHLSYALMYKWGAVNTEVASAYIKLDTARYQGKPAYHSTIFVKSAPFFDIFFKMRENFQGWMTVENLRPLKFIRDTQEGNYRATNLYYYDWKNMLIHADTNFNWRGNEHYEIPLHECVYDIGSILYACRNMDTSGMNVGDKYPLSFAIDDSVFDVRLTFRGPQTLKDKYIGSVKVLSFSCSVVSGALFAGDEEFYVWVSDDALHLPVAMMAPLKVGAVRGWLKEYAGLKYSFDALQK